jgi:phospho-N-acetylmuramoyl-pentapeptide-transferase
MERVLAAGLLAMIISIVAGPKFIEFLRRNEMGQHIREEGPESHRVKQGTPTMGGLLLVFSRRSRSCCSATTTEAWPSTA